MRASRGLGGMEGPVCEPRTDPHSGCALSTRQRSKHCLLIATGKAVKKDGFATERHAQRWRAVIMCRTTGHALRARPSAASTFADTACGPFQ